MSEIKIDDKTGLPIHNEVQAEIEKYAGDYPPKNIND